tara:strand:+ start:5137 stop:5301 length:165 start_codon:yes stop_codon:yes gene_type:complete
MNKHMTKTVARPSMMTPYLKKQHIHRVSILGKNTTQAFQEEGAINRYTREILEI